MSVLVTGAAGFIGFHVCKSLLAKNENVLGIDNLNNYYEVTLKEARLAELKQNKDFTFRKIDLADRENILALKNNDIDRIIHLAAQAGVRYSLTNPYAYIDSNIVGQINMLELCRSITNLKHFVYASSSSVYGANTKLPFSVEDRTDNPVSLYAATKRADELLTYSYSHLYKIPATGLRFFTVYGPWGRPDMAAFIFTKAIFEDKEIFVFNQGNMKRNFTYIDDIVAGTLGCLDKPAKPDEKGAPHALYNIGNNRSEQLMYFIEVLEKKIGKKAIKNLQPMQKGDVKETIADIDATMKDFGFNPKTNIEEGLGHFVDWFRSFYNKN